MADFRNDPDLSYEEKLRIAGDNWLECAYQMRKFDEECFKCWEEERKQKERMRRANENQEEREQEFTEIINKEETPKSKSDDDRQNIQ